MAETPLCTDTINTADEHTIDMANLQKSPTTQTLSGPRANIFMIFIVLTQLVQMIPFGAGINAGSTLSVAVGSTQEKGAWIAAAYPLTSGTFVLVGGPLGAIYGHKNLLTLGAIWWVFWTLATIVADNIVAMAFIRGLAGVGGGFMTPNAVALLGITFSPGKRRNLSMALFGAMAPVGAAGGSLVAAAFVQEVRWKWLFFFLAILGLVVYTVALLIVPRDEPLHPGAKVDWIGSYLGVAGLILFNFVWNQAPFVGWDKPYIYILLIISLLHLAVFLIWEAKFASNPLIPIHIFNSPSFTVLLVVLWLAFMSIGIYIWYTDILLYTFRGFNNVEIGIGYLPLTILGTVAAFLAGWLVARLPAQVILAIGCTCAAVSNILIATTPKHQIYWAMIFPSMVIVAFTADLIFASAQIIASNSVPRKYQGAAGSLIGTLLTYSMSTGLGFAGTVDVYLNKQGKDKLRGIRGAEYLAIGLAVMALVLDLVFVRIPKAVKEGWDEGDDVHNTGGEEAKSV